MNRFPGKCPVCDSEMMVTRLQCPQCETVLEGQFRLPTNPLSQLTPDQVKFVMAFIRCEGRFTRLEEELHLSYPTLRNRLGEITRALGYEPASEEVAPRLSPDDRRQILEELAQGKIPYAEAERRLQGKRDESAGSA